MISLILTLLLLLSAGWAYPFNSQSILKNDIIKPKVFIVTMFEPEEKVWTSKINFTHNITVLGLSPMYPNVHCTEDFSICHFTTGEGEINAASSVAFLLSSSKFDLSKTYWLLSGIAGGEPTQVTTGSITFAKFAVQIGLQYQIDSRELIDKYSSWGAGYIGLGAQDPYGYPDSAYGTEVFELNEKLRDRALDLAKKSGLQLSVGDQENIELRKLFGYSPASEVPTILGCDVLTSDTYFSGKVLGEYFGNYTKLITNGTATYCATAQEENASLTSFLRVANSGLIDYERIVVLRTISNFARGPPSLENDPVDYFLNHPKGGIDHSLDNLYVGGWPFISDVIEHWEDIYSEGSALRAENYVGDIFGTLGGKPDFGKAKYEIR